MNRQLKVMLLWLIGALLFLLIVPTLIDRIEAQSADVKVRTLYGATGFARHVGQNYQVGCTTPEGTKVVMGSSKKSFDEALALTGTKPVQPKPGEIVLFVCNDNKSTPAPLAVSMTNTKTCQVDVHAQPGSYPIQSLSLLMDGKTLQQAVNVETLTYQVDLKKAGEGPHGLSAVATDTGGLQGSAFAVFTVTKTQSQWACQ